MTTTETPQTAVQDFQERVQSARDRFDTLVQWHLNAHLNGGLELPSTPNDQYIYATKRNPNNWTEIDVDATTMCLTKIVTYLRSLHLKVDKSYDDDQFTLHVIISEFPLVKIRYVADRQTVCTKKVIGTKIIPATTSPERVIEDVEWECTKISLIGLNNDN